MAADDPPWLHSPIAQVKLQTAESHAAVRLDNLHWRFGSSWANLAQKNWNFYIWRLQRAPAESAGWSLQLITHPVSWGSNDSPDIPNQNQWRKWRFGTKKTCSSTLRPSKKNGDVWCLPSLVKVFQLLIELLAKRKRMARAATHLAINTWKKFDMNFGFLLILRKFDHNCLDSKTVRVCHLSRCVFRVFGPRFLPFVPPAHVPGRHGWWCLGPCWPTPGELGQFIPDIQSWLIVKRKNEEFRKIKVDLFWKNWLTKFKRKLTYFRIVEKTLKTNSERYQSYIIPKRSIDGTAKKKFRPSWACRSCFSALISRRRSLISRIRETFSCKVRAQTPKKKRFSFWEQPSFFFGYEHVFPQLFESWESSACMMRMLSMRWAWLSWLWFLSIKGQGISLREFQKYWIDLLSPTGNSMVFN